MLQNANTLHSLFVQQMAIFTAFDSTLNTAYASQWLASINAAATAVQDSQVKDILAQYTQALWQKMEECISKYNDIQYFAGKAFASNKAIQGEFAAENKTALCTKPDRMIEYLSIAHAACVKYQAQLAAVGFTTAAIAQLPTLAVALQAALTAQQSYKHNRPVQSSDRVQLLNNCYLKMLTISKAAKLVYAGNKAGWEQFKV